MSRFTRGRINLLLLAACALLIATSAAPAYAQLVYGSVVGTVEDQTGAVVPNAAVVLTNRETNQNREGNTDSEGRYSFANVLPGRYNVKVTATGFRTTNQNDFEVNPAIVARIDVKLEVGQLADQVTVEANAALLQTDKADTHTELNAKQIENLPLGGYRNYQTLINLVPGAMPAMFQNSITDTPGRALNTHINGGNAQTNMTRIDGAESVNVWLPHHVGYVAPEETVDVVNVTTGSADAEQGLAGASAITLVTKSGSNEIHGSAFEFHDDQHLKARNFFQGYGTPIPVSIYNNYGATLGGKIIRNKLFYFGSFDGTKQKQGGPGFYTVPTADQRNGDFSAYGSKIYDPNTGNPDGTGRTPFPNNVIPANRISTIAQKIQSYYPAPNLPGTINNYTATGGPILDRNYYDLKLNYNRNEKHVIWGKYGRMNAKAGGAGVFGIAGGSGLGGADPGIGNTTTQLATIGHTYTLSAHLLLDGVVGYQRQVQTVLGNDYGTNYGQQFGIPGTNGPDIRQSGFPNINFAVGYSAMGVPNWMPLFRTDESYTHSDNLTWTKGSHEVRFGFDLVRHHLNHWQPELAAGGPRGYLDFSGGVTALNGGPSPTQYNAYAAFLLGLTDNTQKGLQYILATGREWQFGWYVADRWQVSQKLTVNVGLRYELYPLMTRAGYGIERYDPSTNLVYMGGRGNVPENAGISVSHKLFAPRLGIAYRLDDKTVIRTGYGINFDPIPFSRP
ncbi:MAG: TonB-dependent receptor, partial [Acidobacteriaceae bacterium]|nr:TonB-dependent receptor [Acidobacteriaceae bacterium]